MYNNILNNTQIRANLESLQIRLVFLHCKIGSYICISIQTYEICIKILKGFSRILRS